MQATAEREGPAGGAPAPPETPGPNPWAAQVARLGEAVGEAIAGFGAWSRLLLANLGCALRLGFKFSRFIDCVYHYGVTSLPIVVVVAFFVGMVLTVQIAPELERFGIEQRVSKLVVVALLRELGPAFTALLVAGRAGSAITAELGSMKISEQIQAMRILSLDLNRHFLTPMLLAVSFSTFALAIAFNAVGIAGSYLIGTQSLGIPFHTYHYAILQSLDATDLTTGLIKATLFGAIIAITGAYHGLGAAGGGKGVGEATKRSVVAASVAILVSDFFFTKGLMYLVG